MGDYLKAREWLGGDEVKKCYYVWGGEGVLVADVVGRVRRAVDVHDEQVLHGGEVTAEQLAASVTRTGLAGAETLTIIYASEQVDDWDWFERWATSRAFPGSCVVMVDYRDRVDTSKPPLDRVKKSGRMVNTRCATADKRVDVLRRVHSIGVYAARELVERTSTVSEAYWVAEQAYRVGGVLSVESVRAMLDATSDPITTYCTRLLAVDRRAACAVAGDVPTTAYARVFGWLSQSVLLALVVASSLARDHGMRDVSIALGRYSHMAPDLIEFARYYSPSDVARRLRLIASMEREHVRGASGVLDLLALSW